jgi:hypothetical protein
MQKQTTPETTAPFDEHYPTEGLPLPATQSKTISSLCKQSDFLTDRYKFWCDFMREVPRFHRKQWEFYYVAESLFQRGLLSPGKRGLGFAIGREPLPACFATLGCSITATDLPPEDSVAQGWDSTNQWCGGLANLNDRGICDPNTFSRLVKYRPVDMNVIPTDLRDYDFNWSSCSFEHLGSISKGLAFLRNQLDTLKPGGIAVHTTEYNISSNHDTLELENCVIFRQQDIERVTDEIRSQGHHVEELDFSLGWHPLDYKIDLPPYKSAPHLRLQLDRYVCTSIGIIIQKKKQ